ncbi:hypothetical protein [Photobacterium leiognathi]|nr:hypothetical protein [Photobacterium leiognathi]
MKKVNVEKTKQVRGGFAILLVGLVHGIAGASLGIASAIVQGNRSSSGS